MASTQQKLPSVLSSSIVTFPKFTQILEIRKSEIVETLEVINENKGKFVLAFYDEETDSFSPVGTTVKLLNITEDAGKPDKIEMSILGLERVLISDLQPKNNVLYATFEKVNETGLTSAATKKLQEKLSILLKDDANGLDVESEMGKSFTVGNPPILADVFAHVLIKERSFKLQILSELNVTKRLEIIFNRLFDISADPVSVNSVNEEIQNKVKDKVSKQQKEFFLREQLKVIQDELKLLNGELSDIDEYRSRTVDNPYPEHIKKKLLKEITKLESIPSQAAEAGVVRQYIETLLDLPYWQTTKEELNVSKVKRSLNVDHWGLKKPKDRIIEYLAVKQMNPQAGGTIISFVGPPGTGKTSLAKSITNALGRKFVKVSLGGLKDESEIRGHRRTYIGALPGRIIQAVKKSGVVNPVILLDEIDKMSSDYKGDPTSAMLEVLDLEQNKSFQDHYVEEEYDLSQVMFIATANYYSRIPEPLLDRLDVIDLSSYTELEKIQIAKKHLIPEILEETKIQKSKFNFSDKSLSFIISHYTMEAGVRQLKRSLTDIARKQLVLSLEKKTVASSITELVIKKLLGNIKYDYTKKEKMPIVGVTTGLAWTPYGGDILPIEIVEYTGKGELVLTGQLKDVMRESAGIAFSYIKANAKKLGIQETISKDVNAFNNFDFHVHSPDGATPKDGPSAGVTFTTSMISLLLNKPISQDIAMTGEITLNGKVLPIGGLREKAISANRSGIKTIFIPEQNKNDLTDIPIEVRKALKIIQVKTYDDIFKVLFK